jgi:ribulose-5-phosphate 4-epimerase/fuculose-1-phosphate aldolase
MIDEGYTKFTVHWDDRSPLDHPAVAELERWRRPLFAAGLIGHYPESGVGYGNLSMRVEGSRLFVVSGTRTGHLAHTDRRHYALVTRANMEQNSVRCTGETQASSETLTHAAMYELDLSINAVVHVHSELLWERLKDRAPTTDAGVAYGTPEMASEFKRLYRTTSLPDTRVAVMAGHESGLVTIGGSLEEAALRILSLHAEYVCES